MAKRVDWDNRKLTWAYDIIPLVAILALGWGFIGMCLYVQGGRLELAQAAVAVLVMSVLNLIRAKVIEHVEGVEE